MKIAQLIADHRKSRNLTLRQLAAETGVDQCTLSRLERGLGLPNRKNWLNLIRWVFGD